jgi:hypothetical protein
LQLHLDFFPFADSILSSDFRKLPMAKEKLQLASSILSLANSILPLATADKQTEKRHFNPPYLPRICTHFALLPHTRQTHKKRKESASPRTGSPFIEQ